MPVVMILPVLLAGSKPGPGGLPMRPRLPPAAGLLPLEAWLECYRETPSSGSEFERTAVRLPAATSGLRTRSQPLAVMRNS